MLTRLQVFLTTPMFNFLDDTRPLLTKRGVPLAIYWGVTCLAFILLLIILYLLHNPIVVCNLMDRLLPLKTAQQSAFYKVCRQRSWELNAEAEGKKGHEDGAANQKEKPVDRNRGHGAEEQKDKALSNKGMPEQQSYQANGVNGKSIGTDGSSQGESKSSAGWFHRGRVALCCDV